MPHIHMRAAALMIVALCYAYPAQAGLFKFDFTLNDSNLQAIIDDAGGSTGFVSFDGNVAAGDYRFDSLTNLQMSFTFGGSTVTLANSNDPLNINVLRIAGTQGSQEIVRIQDVVGSFVQFFNGPLALAFPRADGQFRLGHSTLLSGLGINNRGTFTAVQVTEPSTLGLLGLVLLGIGLLRRKKLQSA